MTGLLTQGVLYVHSVPRALCPHLEWAAGRAIGRAVNFEWTPQPLIEGTQRAAFSWQAPQGTGAVLASALRGWEDLRFEVTEDPSSGVDGSRWMHTPQLGIFYAQTDSVGNSVIPEDRVRYAMDLASGDSHELYRELRVALGQAWDDELDPFRLAGDDDTVVWLHHSVG